MWIILFWNRALSPAELISYLKWAKVGLMLNSCVTGKEDKVEERKPFLSSLLLLPSAWGWVGYVDARGLQRDVVYLGWPIEPSYIRVKMRGREGVAGPQPMSIAVHITWHGAQIYFGDLPPYFTYGAEALRPVCDTCARRLKFFSLFYCDEANVKKSIPHFWKSANFSNFILKLSF